MRREPVIGSGLEAQVTGPAAAVGSGKGLVEIQVGDVTSEGARAGVSHEGVEVCSIDIDLPAGRVNAIGNILDLRFERSVCRGVGQHNCANLARILIDLGVQILDIN